MRFHPNAFKIIKGKSYKIARQILKEFGCTKSEQSAIIRACINNDVMDRPVPHVMCDGKWVPTEDVTFVSNEVDDNGRSYMRFLYNGKEYKSHVVLMHKY